MSFVSPLFLWYFMPAVLIAVLVCPRSWRNGIVAVASLLFYTIGAGPYLFLLLGCMAVNFLAGPSLEPGPWDVRSSRRKRILIGLVTLDVLVLVIWKYAGFASQQIAAVAHWFGGDVGVAHRAADRHLVLHVPPHVATSIDVYAARARRCATRSTSRRTSRCSRSSSPARSSATARSRDQLRRAHATASTTSPPASRGSRCGLAQEGAHRRHARADRRRGVLDAAGDLTTFATAWLGAIAYTLQLYFDFSGYSDMAIGLGRMFGFRLPENFDSAVLGGHHHRVLAALAHVPVALVPRLPLHPARRQPRRDRARPTATSCIVFVLTGLWHGANWTFLVWGLLPRRAAWSSNAGFTWATPRPARPPASPAGC